MKIIKKKKFANGIVYALNTHDGYPIETTDTFLPYYTKDAVGRKQNSLTHKDMGSRKERWMIGVSVMSGCPVGCKFCATGKLNKCRNLTSDEIVEQVLFIIYNNENYNPRESMEFKINYTRMGEPFLNIENVKEAIFKINKLFPNVHHYISTIGVKNSDFSWVKDNITLQFSIHSFDEEYRDWLIPFKNKMKISQIGKVRTESKLKTTLNMTMARVEDFSIKKMKKYFDKDNFFVKISPINENDVSKVNGMGFGIIKQSNIL